MSADRKFLRDVIAIAILDMRRAYQTCSDMYGGEIGFTSIYRCLIIMIKRSRMILFFTRYSI